MKEKIITFRADEGDLERIEQVKTELQKINKYIKITTSDVIAAGIGEIWNQLCLPYKDEDKPYKYRAEKDIPYI